MAYESKPTKDTLTLAIENNSCSRCKAMGFPTCKCAGVGRGNDKEGSGGSGGGSDETKNAPNETVTSGQVASTSIQEFDKFRTVLVELLLSNDRAIHYDAGLFSIESNKLHGNLIFKINSVSSKDEEEIARQLLEAIKTEFNEFKDHLAEQGVSTKDFTAAIKDNELTIHIRLPYYNAFIKHLENKNLLPIANPEQERKEITHESHGRPSPFTAILKGPKPNGWK